MNLSGESGTLLLDTVTSTHSSFGWLDYALFSLVLIVSLLIGLYFGFFSKQDTTAEYLLGGRRMASFPVATSIIASHVSGITLLGVPSEVYQHGTQYAACAFTSILTCLVTAYIFLPVFYKLQLTSTFEYLEIRFARPVRILSSFLFVVSMFLHIPIVIFVPALAFSQVTDFSVHAITPILCVVCILYTTIGGLKAVVWTDTIQFSVTVGALFTVLVLGIHSVGSIGKVWEISEKGHRLVLFNMDPSPFARNTFWGMVIGMTMTWIGHIGIHPGSVQRFLSVPREKDARQAMSITAIGLIVVKLVSVFTGLIMYAKYFDCDPLLTQAIDRRDQTLPYYVMDVAGNVPGLPGLFVAGLVSAALATMSAGLNTMSGIVYEDFIRPWIPERHQSEARAANIMKIIVMISGVISIGLVFVVEHLGTIFQISLSVRGVTDGASLGLFVLGILVPWSNANGAMLGGCVSLLGMVYLVVGNEWYEAQGRIRHEVLPTSVNGCPYPMNETHDGTFNATIETLSPDPDAEPPLLFKISFMYYTTIGCVITVLVGCLGSYVFGEMSLEDVNPDHVTPFMRRFLPRREYGEVPLKEMTTSRTRDKEGSKEGQIHANDKEEKKERKTEERGRA